MADDSLNTKLHRWHVYFSMDLACVSGANLGRTAAIMAAEEVLESSAHVHQLLKVILSTSERPSAQTIKSVLNGQHNSGPEVRVVSSFLHKHWTGFQTNNKTCRNRPPTPQCLQNYTAATTGAFESTALATQSLAQPS